MINLNDSQFDVKTVKIFNNGVAGVANGCSMRLEKKKASDTDNAPAYKLFMVDPMRAEINKGYFPVKEEASDAAKTFFVKEMKHLAGLVGAELPATIESYNQLMDVVMKGAFEKSTGKLFNVFVSYGMKTNPKKYLEISSAFSITQAAEQPWINPKAQMTRIDPTGADSLAPQAGDLPFDTPNGTAANTGW
jgi:hypothetical protein